MLLVEELQIWNLAEPYLQICAWNKETQVKQTNHNAMNPANLNQPMSPCSQIRHTLIWIIVTSKICLYFLQKRYSKRCKTAFKRKSTIWNWNKQNSKVLCSSLQSLEKKINIIRAMSWENLFLPYTNNKGADQPAHARSLISALVVRCLDNIIPRLAIAEISRLYLVSEAEQTGLSLTWSKTPKTGFLVTRLIQASVPQELL